MAGPSIRPASLSAGVHRIVAAALLLVSFTDQAVAQQCWAKGPAHGSSGLLVSDLLAARSWDPDGAGPSGPWLIASGASEWQSPDVWTGTEWAPFPWYFDLPVAAYEVFAGQLHAVGSFTQINGLPLPCLARWNGSQWESVGPGIGGDPGDQAHAVLSYGGWLWVGGDFRSPVSTAETSCAAWNGAYWVDVDLDLPPLWTVTDFAVLNGQLYASARMGSSAGAVYRFVNPNWTRIGDIADNAVQTVEGYAGQLFAGGYFTDYAGQSTSRIARWNGSDWVPLGQGITNAQGGDAVRVLREYNGSLIAGGRFSQMDGQEFTNIAAWNGSSWSGLTTGTPYNNYNTGVFTLELHAGELIVVGDFSSAGDLLTQGIARWNGASWRAFMEGINAPVLSFFNAGGTLYAGGAFDFTLGGADLHHIVGWSESGLYNVAGVGGPAGVSGDVAALTMHSFNRFEGPKLYVGGTFIYAGGIYAANVASFGLGTTFGWSAVGAGFNSTVRALASYGGTVWAAGDFTASGATPLPHLARLSGGWVDPGLGSFGLIQAMGVAGGSLILGGVPGGANGVSSWNGSTLTVYGISDGSVLALTTFEGDLVVGGAFTTIDGQHTLGVARRDAVTGQWSAMGQGFSFGVVRALAVHNDQLFAGGSIVPPPGLLNYGLAVWTGSDWTAVCDGNGLNGPVYALTSFDGKLHVGGDFQSYKDTYGNQWLTPYWAEFSNGAATAALPLLPSGPTLGMSFPNPAHALSQLEYTLHRSGSANLSVYDLRGRRVRVLRDGWHPAGSHGAVWDGRDDAGQASAAGVYVYRLESDGSVRTQRMILLQ